MGDDAARSRGKVSEGRRRLRQGGGAFVARAIARGNRSARSASSTRTTTSAGSFTSNARLARITPSTAFRRRTFPSTPKFKPFSNKSKSPASEAADGNRSPGPRPRGCRSPSPAPRRARRHHRVFLEPVLGARTVAGGFLLEEFLGERRNRRGHFCEVDGVESGRWVAADGALFGEVADLHHRAGAVRLGDPEANGAKSFAEDTTRRFRSAFPSESRRDRRATSRRSCR